MDLDVKTVDKVYRREGVDEASLRHAFDKLKITPGFSKELHCVSILSTKSNLPRLSTRFIGRETEIESVVSLLRQTRLVALMGSGGCGKTRLSLEVAKCVLDDYEDGVRYVELAPLSDAMLVPQAIATATSCPEIPEEPIDRTLIQFLQEKIMLLVLDNSEHVLGEAARLVEAILKSCSQVNILLTSREKPDIEGERIYRVPPLSVPKRAKTYTPEAVSHCEAVRLLSIVRRWPGRGLQ